ncbi:MAG: TerB family tellurite resistance protein [Methyloceanibacter sp.]
MADQPKGQGADFILMAMVAVAAADGKLDEREVGLIQQIYRDQSGQTLRPDEIRAAAEAKARDGGLLTILAAAADSLDKETKEEIIRASYLVLLADDRIAGEERKKLQDIAAALRIPEIHFGAILEDLAIWLSSPRS